MTYQIQNNSYTGVAETIRQILDDGRIQILPISDNGTPEYQEYLAWLAEGNEPLPADEPS